MSKDNLDQLFDSFKNDFDIEEPNADHRQRFVAKLNTQNNPEVVTIAFHRNIWKPIVAVAASIVLIVTLFVGGQQDVYAKDLASISPEMAETQSFFTNTISNELSKFEKESNPESKLLIKDAMIQIHARKRVRNAKERFK